MRAEDYAELLSAAQIVAQAHRRADEIVAEAERSSSASAGEATRRAPRSAYGSGGEDDETVSRTIDYFAGIENEMIELVMSAVRKIVDGYDDPRAHRDRRAQRIGGRRNQRQMTLRLHPTRWMCSGKA